MKRASTYNVLKQRRAAWKRELDAPKSRYSKKSIRSAIAALDSKIQEALAGQMP